MTMTADDKLHLAEIEKEAAKLQQLISDIDGGQGESREVFTALAMLESSLFWARYHLSKKRENEQ
jgi:hypothetical protein